MATSKASALDEPTTLKTEGLKMVDAHKKEALEEMRARFNLNA